MCIYVLQEELRPEYEEALQEKKAKMKAQSKKKVLCLSVCFCVSDMTCNTKENFAHSVFTLLQLTKAGDGVDGETDQMLTSQVAMHCSV